MHGIVELAFPEIRIYGGLGPLRHLRKALALLALMRRSGWLLRLIHIMTTSLRLRVYLTNVLVRLLLRFTISVTQ